MVTPTDPVPTRPTATPPRRRGPKGALARPVLLAGLFVLLLLLSVVAVWGSASAQAVSPQARTAEPGRSSALGSSPTLPSDALPVAPSEPGWPTPRGPLDQNASTIGYGPEAIPGEAPPVMAQVSLGRWAGDSAGMAVAPGGPLLLALGNDTIWALNSSTLSTEWWYNVSQPLVGGPSVGGTMVFAVGASGEVYAWSLTDATGNWAPAWTYNGIGSPDQGAAPLPYGGDVYVLTEGYLTALNGSTGAFLVQGPSDNTDPTHSLAWSPWGLLGQRDDGLDHLNTFSLFGQRNSSIGDDVYTGGATLYSDGYASVAGSQGDLDGGIALAANWTSKLVSDTSSTSIDPMAAGGGWVYATDGQGPLFGYSHTQNSPSWSSTTWVTSAPTLAGSVVLVGVNDSVAAFATSRGTMLWQVPTPGDVVAPLAVANGIVYAVDASGNVTALGYPPVSVSASLGAPNSATLAGDVGSPVSFTSAVSGGVQTSLTVQWLFSNGATLSGAQVQETFDQAGPAWATAVATDTLGYVSPPSTVVFTIDPTMNVLLTNSSATFGSVPLYENFSALPSGGSGAYDLVAFQVTGKLVENVSSGYLATKLLFSTPGEYNVTAWVTDSNGAVARSGTRTVVAVAATPTPPKVVAVQTGPSTVEVLWTAPAAPGFQAWWVEVSEDHGPWTNVATLPGVNTTSYVLTGLPMDLNLSVQVGRMDEFGPTLLSSPVNLTTPVLAPVLGISAAPGLPGQALLSWSLPAPLDNFGQWVLLETFPGATAPVAIDLPRYEGASNVSYTTAPVRDGVTTSFALELLLLDGRNATSATVPFTPLFALPQVAVSSSDLNARVTWVTDLPDFSSVSVCYASSTAGPWTCPATSADPTSAPSVISFAFPSAGTFVVNLTAHAQNGFGVSASPVLLSVLAAPAWYATPYAGIVLWAWAIILLLLIGLVALGYFLYRERTTIPPYLGEVLPWDPLSPEASPHARPTSPETLDTEPRLHRHRASHPHRHLRRHGTEPGQEEGASAAAGEGATEEPRLKPPRKPAAKVAPAAEPPASNEEEGTESEEASPSAARPSSRSSARTSRSAEKIDEVGANEGSAGSSDDESEGTLDKLPVVLRHREGSAGSSEGAPARPPSFVRKPAPSGEEASSGGDEEEAPEKPKRPASRPKPPADEEPTL